jgi:hypothetical protein
MGSFIQRMTELVDRVMHKAGIQNGTLNDVPFDIIVPPGTRITITIRTEPTSGTQTGK